MVEVLSPKQRSAIERAKRTPELQWVLFSRASGLKWFDAFQEAGFLNPAEIPGPETGSNGSVSIPNWPIIQYLAALGEELCLPENIQYAQRVLNFIRQATSHARANGISNYRVWWHFSKTLSRIPPEVLSAEDISHVDYWLSDPYETGLVAEEVGDWFAVLLEVIPGRRDLLLKILSVLYQVEPDGSESKRLRFNSWYAEKLNKKIADPIGRVLGIGAVQFFHDQLGLVVGDSDNDQWSSIWRPAIEEHKQNRHTQELEDILIDVFRDALVSFASINAGAARAFSAQVLSANLETPKRVVIFAIDRCYQALGPLAESLISEPFFSSNMRHEMWWLLHNHFHEFTEELQRRTISVIEDMSASDDGDRDNRDSASAYRRASWLSSIRHDDSARERYQHYVSVAGAEPEHPDFSSYFTSGWIGHESPIPVEELRSLEPALLVEKLNSFPSEMRPRIDGADYEGLVRAVRGLVKADPLRYSQGFGELAHLEIPFAHEVLEAFVELWNEKASLPWSTIWPSLLAFASAMVRRDDFWSSDAKQRGNFVANGSWFVGTIGRLIEAGTRSDDHAMPAELEGSAMDLLTFLLSRQQGAAFSVDKDALSISINSARGRCLEGLINLTLRACRVEDATRQSHSAAWERYRGVYESELARRRTDGEYEFVTLFARYLGNFLYMAKDWTRAHLQDAFDLSDYMSWLSAMQGYAYSGAVYETVYKFLKDEGHFEKALDDINLRDQMHGKVVQNIAIAYLRGYEKLEDPASLINLLISRGNTSELQELTRFLWALHRSEGREFDQSIVKLWPEILERISEQPTLRSVGAKLTDWIVYLKAIDAENLAWVLSSIACMDQDKYGGNSYSLLQNVARISERQPIEASVIWKALLERSHADYPNDAIESALRNIASARPNGVRIAKEIASEYLKKGNIRPEEKLSSILRSEF